MEKEWWESEENVILLAFWLIGNDYFEIYDSREDALNVLIHIIEKPWHYEKEWQEYQQ